MVLHKDSLLGVGGEERVQPDEDGNDQDLQQEIFVELEKRIPEKIKREEFEHIKLLVLNATSTTYNACDNTQLSEPKPLLSTVLEEAGAVRSAPRHPTLDRIQKFFCRHIKTIERFGAALDILSQAGGTPGLLIWGSFRVLLKATEDLREIPTFINESLEELNNALPLWDTYQEIIREGRASRLRRPAILICVEYLTFCLLVKRYSKPKLWGIENSATKVLQDKLRPCIKAIREQRHLIDHWFGASTFHEVYQIAMRLDSLRYKMDEVFPTQATPGHESERAIRSVPGLLSQRFTGREEDIDWLENMLQPDHIVDSGKRVALYGMTGIGKTQLMLKYEEMFRDRYPVASLFVTAGSKEKFVKSCNDILNVLGLPEHEKPEPDMKIYGFKKWLGQRGGWLLMIDNVNNTVLDSVKNLLESAKRGHVILTSQNLAAVDGVTPGMSACREVKELNEKDATRLFLITSNIHETSQNTSLAQEVVKEVGCLPHIIDQSAWYVRKHDISIPQYLERYRNKPSEILQWHDQHGSSIVQHFNMALEDLSRNHPDALKILTLLSFFEPEAIPRFTTWHRDSSNNPFRPHQPVAVDKSSLIRRLCNFCSFREKPIFSRAVNLNALGTNQIYDDVSVIVKNSSRFEDAIGELWNFNHVRKGSEKGVLWMHDITRQMAEISITPGDSLQWLDAAIAIIYHTFPETDNTPSERSVVDIYLPQATALLKKAKRHTMDLGRYADLLVICAQCYHNRGEYRKAIDWYEGALPFYTCYVGDRNSRTVTLRHRLGWSYRESGDHLQAEKIFRQTLELRSNIHGPKSAEALESLNDLAALIERLGQLKEAEKLFTQLHKREIATFGRNSPITLAGGHNLALCYANQGRLSEAEELYRRTLNVSEKALAKDDEGTIKTLGNLAVTLDHQGKLLEAEALYNRTLEAYTHLLGYDDLLSLRVRSNLSGLYRQQGLFDRAEQTIKEALKVYLRILGSSHFHIAVAMYDIAEVLHDRGNLHNAKMLYESSIQMMQVEGPGHPLMFRTMDAAGILERERGCLVRSRTWAQRSYEGNLGLLGWQDPYTLVAANNYAELLHVEGRYNEASNLYYKCLEGFRGLLGPSHPHYLMVLNNIGRLCWTGEGADAMTFFTRAYEGLEICLGLTHFCTLTVALNIARTHLIAGHLDEAHDMMTKIREMHKEAPEISLSRVGVVEFFLGMVTAATGNPCSMTGAIMHFKNAADSYVMTLGASHPNYLWARCMLLRVLYVDGQTEEAAIYESSIGSQIGLNEPVGPELVGLGHLTYRDLISVKSKHLGWKACMQLPFGETIRLRWGRKTVWREKEPAKLNS